MRSGADWLGQHGGRAGQERAESEDDGAREERDAQASCGGAKGNRERENTGTAKATGSPKTTASPKATKATGHAKTTTTSTTTTRNTSGTTTSTGTMITLTPVQQKLQRNTNLASKLQSRLPAGTDLGTAAAGFRNLGQFVAAVNVSNNLGLDFTTLKTAMVTDGKSLGQAIQSQKGTTVNATQEAQRAQADADAVIRATEKNGKKNTGNQRP